MESDRDIGLTQKLILSNNMGTPMSINNTPEDGRTRRTSLMATPGLGYSESEVNSLYNDLEGERVWLCCMKGKSSMHSRTKRLLKFSFAVFNVCNAAMGAGILAFPYAFRQSGWIMGVLITLACAAVLCYSLTVILRSARKHRGRSYQDLVLIQFGPRWRNLLLVVMMTYAFFACVGYLLIISSQVYAFVVDAAPNSIVANKNLLVAIAAVAVSPLSFLRDMSALGPASFIGVLAVVYAVALVIYYGAENMHYHKDFPEFKWTFAIFQSIPIIAFALMCHLTVIPATIGTDLQPYWPSLNNPSYPRYRTLVYICIFVITICFTLYIPMGIFGIFCFGEYVSEDILDNFGTQVSDDQVPILSNSFDVKIGRLCMALTTALGFPVLTLIARKAMYDALQWKGVVKMKEHVIVTVLFIGGTACIAIVINIANLGIGWIMGFIGSTAAVSVQFVFPALMDLQDKRYSKAYFLFVCGGIILTAGLGITFVKVLCTTEAIDENICTALAVQYGAP